MKNELLQDFFNECYHDSLDEEDKVFTDAADCTHPDRW